MKDKELKSLLKDAYQIKPSKKEITFVRQYEQRSMRILNVIFMEMSYIGLSSGLVGSVLLLFLFLIARSDNPNLMWYISGSLPLAALILMSGIGRSERYGMQELEAASRFSLKFIRLIRMLILGMASLILLSAASILLQKQAGFSAVTILGFVGTPYMLNVWANLLITRKWQEKENLLACIGVTCLSAMLPLLFERALQIPSLKPAGIIAILIILLAGTVRESILLMKESEDLSWNLC